MAAKQAEEGMRLLKAGQGDVPVSTDREAAEAYKSSIEERIAILEAEAAKLTGKDNKKERTAKGKEVAELKADAQYVDACKVAKGLEPKNGFFVTRSRAPVPPPDTPPPPQPSANTDAVAQAAVTSPQAARREREERKPRKKDQSATAKEEPVGLTPTEATELEHLKSGIIERKLQLKADGLTGAQQNSDPQIVEWVLRMNELKEKQEPGSKQKDVQKDGKKDDRRKRNQPLSPEEQRQREKLQAEIDEYRRECRVQFGYSNKDLKADPELQEMEARLAALERRAS